MSATQSPDLCSKKLGYSIHAYSGYSNNYVPQNIMENRPSEQSSRWSSDTNNPPQFITVKLDKPAIVTGISFGKFEKTHVCNLKKFKVFGGFDDNTFVELLDSGLKNDNTQESFNTKHRLNNHYFPCAYVKIQPIQSWGSSFNFSVWYVELSGDDNHVIVEESMEWQRAFRERETIRLCLKHFREQNYTEAFESLEKKTKVQLEDPVLTTLHTTLVKEGNYEAVEKLMLKSLKDGLFSDFISDQQPKPVWSPLIYPEEKTLEDIVTPGSQSGGPVSPDSESLTSDDERTSLSDQPVPSEPPPRGGHQMVIDSASQTVYLFGGWDGKQDLADLWSYHIPTARWSLLFGNCESEGGPPPRSCHKMVLDPTYRQIFLLGRYVEKTLRERSAIKSDFYLYDIDTNKWTQISDDTSACGGPSLIFDHQMCLDNEKRNIFVFGGQSLHFNSDTSDDSRADKRFSGLYVYHISTSTWRCLWEDGDVISKGPQIKSRTGHSMLFNTADRNLYIFGGQRKRDEYMNDFLTLNVDNETVTFLADGINNSGSSIPAVGYTQRATIDCARGEIHVLTGLNKDKDKKVTGDTRVSNSFWVYEIHSKRWSCLYRNEKNSPSYWNSRQTVEPRPRYAHQLVYESETGMHYLFGGNPGGKEGKQGKIRLGDFWRLQLVRPAVRDLERFCTLAVRTAKYKELCRSPFDAVKYLQNNLTHCVDHQDDEQESQFQMLPTTVFAKENQLSEYKIRTQLFNSLVIFFPDHMTQPAGNLLDLIPLESADRQKQPGSLQASLSAALKP